MRINSDDVRLLYSYPSPWQVSLTRPESPAQASWAGRAQQAPPPAAWCCWLPWWQRLRSTKGAHLAVLHQHPSQPAPDRPLSPPCPPPCLLHLQNECVAQRAQRPDYRELEAILRGVTWSMSSKPLADRLQYEAAFLQKSMKPQEPPPRQ